MKRLLFKTFLFSAVVVALSSCGQEGNESLNPMKGDLVALKVNFDGIEEQKPAGASTKTGEPEVQTFIDELGEDLYLETQVTAGVSPVTTRFGSETDLVEGTAVTAIVYKSNGDPFKIQEMTKGSAMLYLPAGESYSVVFYTYNTTTHPEITYNGDTSLDENGSILLTPGSNFADKTESSGTDVMWSRIENTGVITASTRLPNVIFTPVFNRLKWTLTSDFKTFKVISSQIEQPYAKATVKINELLNATDKTRVWTPETAKNDVPLTFASATGMSSVSGRSLFIVDESNSSVLSAAIELDGATRQVRYLVGKLSRGISYSVVSKLVSSSEGGAQLIAPYICVSGKGDNATLVFATKVTDEPVYFQSRSIVGWKYDTAPRHVFNPSSRGTNWTAWSHYSSAPAHNSTNLRQGKGDPCKLVGFTQKQIKDALITDVALDNKTWRLPDAEYYEKLLAAGDYSNTMTIQGVKGKMLGEYDQESISGSVRTFYPFTGYLGFDSGKHYNAGTSGVYYTNTTTDTKTLIFRFSNSTPDCNPYNSLSGLPIRCVPQ